MTDFSPRWGWEVEKKLIEVNIKIVKKVHETQLLQAITAKDQLFAVADVSVTNPVDLETIIKWMNEVFRSFQISILHPRLSPKIFKPRTGKLVKNQTLKDEDRVTMKQVDLDVFVVHPITDLLHEGFPLTEADDIKKLSC